MYRFGLLKRPREAWEILENAFGGLKDLARVPSEFSFMIQLYICGGSLEILADAATWSLSESRTSRVDSDLDCRRVSQRRKAFRCARGGKVDCVSRTRICDSHFGRRRNMLLRTKVVKVE